ncbi:MAG: phosphopantothenoylcysteine decarboxylase [Leptospirales bacterium]|nr:phosphopantothenoylcysteine decarboxylase [Leptospirales bacterium]
MSNESNLLVAVSGGIAAYRACDLVRNLSKAGHRVRVVMTENATRFVGKLSFEALSGQKVFVSEWEEGMPHIDLRQRISLMCVAPATANIIGKMANGIADDLISSIYLAANFPVLVAPSMNPFMYASRPVQRNLGRLREDGVQIIDPQNGEAVCGDEGQGKLASVTQIEAAIQRTLRGGA